MTAVYSYDALNRVTQITYPDETVTYTYDSCSPFGVGRLCSIADKSGTTVYGYDRWGRVTSKTQTVGTVSKTIGYEFNAAGQLSKVTLPSGKQVVYGYSNGRPVSISVDAQVLLDGATYLPFGPVSGWRWGNSTVGQPNFHVRQHDLDYRATRIASDLPATGTQPDFNRTVGWDQASRVMSLSDAANPALSLSYGYDSLDRLTSATQGASGWGYSYNGTGDRLTSTVNGATTTYDYLAGTHKLQSLSGAQSRSFITDAAGNTTFDGANTWSYGGNNRPEQGGGASFKINALGQRVAKTSGGATVNFLYDEAGHLVGEYDSTGAVVNETVWLGDLPVGIATSSLSYVHPDHLGSPRMATSAAANALLWRWDNGEPFGNSAAASSGLAFNLRFPGQYYDVETGKHYNYFRDYDASLGRYIQSDPIGLRAGLNTYSYAFSRPLNWSDAFGLDVTVCFYADAAAGFGHVGFGPGDGSKGTSGFYPGGENGMGQVKPDGQQQKTCTTLPANSDQDDCMEQCRKDRHDNPGPYNVLTRQCTGFVRDCLAQCKIIKKSHRGPFPDQFFMSIGGPNPRGNGSGPPQ